MSEEKLRIYYVWHENDEPMYHEVNDERCAVIRLKELLGNFTPVAYGCEVMAENGDWIEYVDDVGRDIKEIMEQEGREW